MRSEFSTSVAISGTSSDLSGPNRLSTIAVRIPGS